MNKWLFIIVTVLILTAVANNFYMFYLEKNYNFFVEVPCDSETNNCFVRDCSDGECPPNNLEEYRVFDIKASDFGKCEDETCFMECSLREIRCLELMCGDSTEDICSTSRN
jgi:hypothetical protein